MRRTVSLVLATALLLMSAVAVSAQKKKKEKVDPTVREVEGFVLDVGDAPVKGAVVQLKDLRTLAIRSYFTQADGAYHFSGIKRDTDYELKASLDDRSSESRRLTIYDTRAKPRINLRLEPPKDNQGKDNQGKDKGQ